MDVRPFGGRVLVKVDKPRTKTKGGLFLPAAGSKVGGILRGTVVGVGMGGQNTDGVIIPMRVQVEDRVLFIPDFGNSQLKVAEEDHYILPEDGILAIITNETPEELGEVLEVEKVKVPRILKH